MGEPAPRPAGRGRVVAFGAASWNTMIQVDAFPEPIPGGIFPPGWHETVGSSGAGKAMNLGRLGVDVTLHGLLGDDDAGGRVRSALEAAGTGDPTARFDTRHIEELVGGADEVLVSITAQARDVLPIAQRLGRRTWTDLHGTDGERAWEHDFWTADRVFFSGERLADPRPFMRRLHETGRELVVCTLGADGALAVTSDGRWLEIAAEPVETVVDTNGAGDAFLAGTVYGELHGLPIERSLRIGARVAAIAIQSRDLAGVVPPGSLADLLDTTIVGY